MNAQTWLPKVLESSARAGFGVEGIVLNGPWTIPAHHTEGPNMPGHRDGSFD